MGSTHPESTDITNANNETECFLKCELYETVGMTYIVSRRREYTVFSSNAGEIRRLKW